jgi:hypothetical protein
MAKVSIHSQIREAEREVAKRREVYPRLVAKGSMRQAEADLLISYMEAIRDTLLFCRDNQEEFRAFVAARKTGAAQA